MFCYLPFGRLLQRRIEELWGRDNKRARQEAAKVLTVPYQTLSTWLVGNSIPYSTEKRFMVGVFLGWAKNGKDEAGLKRTYEYFLGEECKSTEDERDGHIRGRLLATSVRKRGRWQRFHKRRIKREDKGDDADY